MSDPVNDLVENARAWDRAMVTNDADAIGRYMADDWIIIGPDGSIDSRERFLDLVRSGAVTHDVMESTDLNVRIYGDTGVVLALGVSGGEYRGQPFREVERSTSVFIRRGDRWLCVLTHLSRLPQDA